MYFSPLDDTVYFVKYEQQHGSVAAEGLVEGLRKRKRANGSGSGITV